MSAPQLLLSIEDSELQRQLADCATANSYAVINAAAEHKIESLRAFDGPVALLQVDDFSDQDCKELIASGLLPKIDIIFISDGEPNEAVDKAMRHGVSYHMRQPLDVGFISELLGEIHRELDLSESTAEQVVSSELDQFGLLIGSSPVMRKLYRVVRKAADSPANVLIVGESGAGKELVANTVHLMSSQCDKPFIALNCGALSPELIESELFGHLKGAFTGANKDRAGVFEQAEGGTLFLDEVTEMPMDQQVKLLRVLESGEYRPLGSEKTRKANVRVISATNRDPHEAINEEIFREDLYFRLAHFPIHVPPLRKRGEDISGLAKHFLAYRNAEEDLNKEISIAALEKIAAYTWPGNVRELKHAIERAYILADETIEEDHLIFQQLEEPSSSMATLPAGLPLEEVEKGVILKTLEMNDGNKTETASQLGVSVKTLYNKLEKYQESD